MTLASRLPRVLALLPLALLAATGCATDAEGVYRAPGSLEPAVRVDVRPLEARIGTIEAAVAKSGCIAGGLDGQSVTYSEQASDTRANVLTFEYDAELAAALELPADPAELEIDPAEIAENPPPLGEVSSNDGIVVFTSAEIPANSYGVWYGQVSSTEHPADLIAVSAAGEEHTVGQARIVEWQWAVAIGIGDSCEPPPESDLPAPRL
jgi:hypothetical protein